MEIFSIEEVIATNPRLRQSVVLEPMHAYRHQTRNREDLAFWVATRHLNEFGEREPSTMTISVVDLTGNFTDPEADVLMVRTLCTNFDLPSRFQFGSEAGDFEATGYAAAKTVTALRRPTREHQSIRRARTFMAADLAALFELSVSERRRPDGDAGDTAAA